MSDIQEKFNLMQYGRLSDHSILTMCLYTMDINVCSDMFLPTPIFQLNVTVAPSPVAASAPVAVAATTSSAVPTSLKERRKGDPGVNRFRDMARNIATRGRY